MPRTFPDLKGQAPLRPHGIQDKAIEKFLFLTSKVRLHCDKTRTGLFNTYIDPFPDLKGQAPLPRLGDRHPHARRHPFPDLKGQAPLRPARRPPPPAKPSAFPDLKGQAPLQRSPRPPHVLERQAFPDLKGQAPLRLFAGLEAHRHPILS